VSFDVDPSEVPDGRLARGMRRRAEIIEKTLQIVERDGVAGVSHRTIAAELGISPSALTHHFATLDDLLTAALTSAILWTEASFDQIESIDDLASLLWKQLATERRRLAAAYELYMLAARRPPLRKPARWWVRSLRMVARRLGADRQGELALVAAVDGLGLLALLSDAELTEAGLREVLRRALARPA
jgi:DNA-binding transcriptional regulator YbjK